MEGKKGMKSFLSKNSSHQNLRLQMILYLAARNLRHKQFRSFLTILGVVIGIGSVFLLLSFGMGLQALVQKQITNGEAINTIDVSSSNSKVISLTPERIAQIKTLPEVKGVSGIYTAASKLTMDEASIDVVAYGIDKLYLDLDNPTIVAGKVLDMQKTDEAVMSSSLLSSIGVKDAKGALGKTFTIKVDADVQKPIEKKFKLIGVIDAGSGSEVFISEKVFSSVGVNAFSQVKVLANDRESIPQLRHAIESLGFDTTSPVDTLEQVDQVFRFFSIILAGLGSIGMLIAVLGMLNTLTVSLLERTREIALMMMLGGRPKDMLMLFVSEALILSIVGGILGMLFAMGAGTVVDAVLNQLAQSRGVEESFTVFARPVWLVAGTLIFMTLVGLIVAFIPARRASRINPVEALRQN